MPAAESLGGEQGAGRGVRNSKTSGGQWTRSSAKHAAATGPSNCTKRSDVNTLTTQRMPQRPRTVTAGAGDTTAAAHEYEVYSISRHSKPGYKYLVSPGPQTTISMANTIGHTRVGET